MSETMRPMLRAALSLTLVLVALPGAAAPGALTPLETVERLHQAFYEADSASVDALLHAEYHGLSLQGPPDQRHLYVETRDKAVSDVAKLKRGDWEVRFLKTATQVDPNGLAHVWARYVFYYKGAADHCGYESYSLFRDVSGWKVISFADTDNPLQGKSVDQACPESVTSP